MSLNIYEISVPVLIKNFKTLSSLLKMSEDYAKNKNIDESVFLETRLFPNMLPLKSQIQIATDIVRRGLCRFVDLEPEPFLDDEKNFSDLQNRISKNINFLEGINSDEMQTAENKKFEFSIGESKFKFKNAKEYLLIWIMPHFFFHMTTTYNILRSSGLDIGKKDFISF